MNKIIALLLLLVLLYYNFFKIELFAGETTSASASDSTTSASARTTQSLSFFELSNADKNKINKSEREKEILNIDREEQKMKNDVEKIVKEAKNVLAYSDLNMQYFKDIKFNNEQNEQTNPANSPE